MLPQCRLQVGELELQFPSALPGSRKSSRPLSQVTSKLFEQARPSPGTAGDVDSSYPGSQDAPSIVPCAGPSYRTGTSSCNTWKVWHIKRRHENPSDTKLQLSWHVRLYVVDMLGPGFGRVDALKPSLQRTMVLSCRSEAPISRTWPFGSATEDDSHLSGLHAVLFSNMQSSQRRRKLRSASQFANCWLDRAALYPGEGRRVGWDGMLNEVRRIRCEAQNRAACQYRIKEARLTLSLKAR
eukprot:3735271-Rhodomonas_salina.1